MLQLLRKHQRVVFIFVTFIIVISFSFFGTFSSMQFMQPTQAVTKTLHGSELTYQDLEAMKAFLRSDAQDQEFSEHILEGNFLNDGFLSRDLLKSGLVAILLNQYKDSLAADFHDRFEAEKQYTPYRHPYFKDLGAEQIWKDFSPSLYDNYHHLTKSSDPFAAASVKARIDLFLAEKKFNQNVLKQFIFFEEARRQQNRDLRDDLQRRDLSLFGYKQFDDWFGSGFFNILVQFVYNVSDIAQKKGIEVSKAEVEAFIQHQTQASYQKYRHQLEKQGIDPLYYLKYQLSQLRMSEKDLFKVVHSLLTFRKYFDSVAYSVIDGDLSLKEFTDYAHAKVEIERYSLDGSLDLSSLEDWLLFETYLNAVSDSQFMGVAKTFKDPKQIKKQNPYLVQRRFEVKVQHLSKQFYSSRFSLRQIWDWQLGEQKNWDKLVSTFPELKLQSLSSREQRYSSLQVLGDEQRKELDRFARMQLVKEDKNWLQEAQKDAPSRQLTLVFRGANREMLPGIKDSNDLLAALDALEVGSEATALNAYTQDEENYYHIQVLDKTPDEILSFKEAVEDGALKKQVFGLLSSAYEKQKMTNPQLKDPKRGQVISFNHALPILAKDYLSDSIISLNKSLKELSIEQEIASSFSPSFYSRHRFANLLNFAKQQLSQNKSFDHWLASSVETQERFLPDRIRAEDQFKLKKTSDTLMRKDFTASAQSPFELEEQTWSHVSYPLDGGASFFFVKNKSQKSENHAKELLDKQSFLASEVKIFYFYEILEKLAENRIINPRI